jgi:oligogalacturonide lyase
MTFAAVKVAALLLALADALPRPALAAPVKSWVDPGTGHRVVQITRTPGSATLYFTQNAFTPQGDRMAIQVPEGIALIKLADWSVTLLVADPAARLLFMGRRHRQVYFGSRGRDDAGGPFTVFAADVDSGAVHRVADVPGGSISSINADDSRLLGVYAPPPASLNPDGTLRAAGAASNAIAGGNTYAERKPDGTPYTYAQARTLALRRRLAARIPMEMFTIDLATGARNVVLRATDWLNHPQFSPTDPSLILYCHEGPWDEVDRIWLIRSDGTGKALVQPRHRPGEIAGHEFFSPDGRTIWYDLQTPQGGLFWLAGYDIATKRRTRFAVPRNEWSIHYNQSPDGRRFSGDGSDSGMIAGARNGRFLYLFTPQPGALASQGHGGEAFAARTWSAAKLVTMARADYTIEPNMVFSPDGHWAIFRASLGDGVQVYAVDLRNPH